MLQTMEIKNISGGAEHMSEEKGCLSYGAQVERRGMVKTLCGTTGI